MKGGGFQQGLDDFTVRRHPDVELVATHVALRPKAPPGTRKRAASPSIGSADGQWHRVDDDLCAASVLAGDSFEAFQETEATGVRLGGRGKIGADFPQHQPPNRRKRMLEDETAEQPGRQ